MIALAFSQSGWAAIQLSACINDPAIANKAAYVLLTDRSAFPGCTLPESLAMAVMAAHDAATGRG